ncbi:MAG: acyl-CoA dehydrogenase family protein [Proteobacteria bacterium]|nr:acyl-CoA dehydrogenase family protein [Pseudomonadota bacterium]
MSVDETLDTDLEAFRAEAKAWIVANYPASLKGKSPLALMEGFGSQDPDFLKWKAAMGAKGWGVPTWPREWGGGGLSRQQARVLQQEMTAAGAFNPIGGMGVMMLGPTLLEYGTEAQKKQHMPGIVNGTVRWCQGYSEPGAGSDLASLRTQAVDKGDHYLVNGQKIWTSGAQFADWCFCLVRTDNAKKHEGISFLLIDMKTPGCEPRPIKLISGASVFCETFFTDVKVPKGNLMGRLNGGWEIAKRLLQFERQNISAGGSGAAGTAAVYDLQDAAKDYVGVAEGKVADRDLRSRITAHKMEARAFQMTIRRAEEEAKSGKGPSAATSVFKYAMAKINQERTELLVEALGTQGLGWEGEGYDPRELQTMRTMLRAKGNSIEGGTSEVNLNVVSKRVLGLLDHQ